MAQGNFKAMIILSPGYNKLVLHYNYNGEIQNSIELS